MMNIQISSDFAQQIATVALGVIALSIPGLLLLAIRHYAKKR